MVKKINYLRTIYFLILISFFSSAKSVGFKILGTSFGDIVLDSWDTVLKINEINPVSSLKFLKINDNELACLNLEALTQLQKLDLSNNGLTSLPSSLSNLKKLIHLDISNNPIKNYGSLFNLSGLQYLNIEGIEKELVFTDSMRQNNPNLDINGENYCFVPSHLCFSY